MLVSEFLCGVFGRRTIHPRGMEYQSNIQLFNLPTIPSFPQYIFAMSTGQPVDTSRLDLTFFGSTEIVDVLDAIFTSALHLWWQQPVILAHRRRWTGDPGNEQDPKVFPCFFPKPPCEKNNISTTQLRCSLICSQFYIVYSRMVTHV